MKPMFVKVMRTTDPANWWNHQGIMGKTFEVLDVSEYRYAKIRYSEKYTGWIPLDACVINPHLHLVK